MSLSGGEKNFKCDLRKAHFTRKDGAWFDFVFTVLETREGLTLLAYDAEIRFPTEPTTKPREGNKHRLPPYIRYDLNFATTRGGAAHDNVDRGLRSHCHPGHDALQAPSPLFHPLDLLDLLVYRLRWD